MLLVPKRKAISELITSSPTWRSISLKQSLNDPRWIEAPVTCADYIYTPTTLILFWPGRDIVFRAYVSYVLWMKFLLFLVYLLILINFTNFSLFGLTEWIHI